MVVNILDVSICFFAPSIVSEAVVLPAFMLRLGASAPLVALLPAIQIVGMRLPRSRCRCSSRSGSGRSPE